jgi:hypothetical protein
MSCRIANEVPSADAAVAVAAQHAARSTYMCMDMSLFLLFSSAAWINSCRYQLYISSYQLSPAISAVVYQISAAVHVAVGCSLFVVLCVAIAIGSWQLDLVRGSWPAG